MAYKVLGQISSTAISTAATTTNLIKDPSFRNLVGSTGWVNRLFTSNTYNSGSSANINYWYNINGNTNWGLSHSTTTNQTITNAGNDGITTAPFGNSKTAIGTFNNGTSSNWILTYGIKNAQSISGTADSAWLNIPTAIPVSAGTTYHAYFSYYGFNSSATPQMDIWFFQANGSIVSTTSVTLTQSVTQNTWTRIGGSVGAAPATSAYAVFQIYTNTNTRAYIDGVYFGTDSTAGSTFVEPLLPSEAVVTAPFDKKISGYQLETPVSTTGTAAAGAQTVLYTVPAGKSSVISTISVANLTTLNTTYRIAVIPSGETLAKKHFTHMDIPINGNTTQTVTIGMTLTAGDKIQIAADTGDVSFTAFGDER